MKSAAQWVARSAAAIALLVLIQFVTRSLGQWITGSAVNLLLALCGMALGAGVAATAALLSPFLAFLVGIGPAMIQVVPAVAVGNLADVLLISALTALWERKREKTVSLGRFPVVILAAAVKCAALYGLIVCWIGPSFLPAKALPTLAASFGILQFFTASIGGVLAALAAPAVCKALRAHP